MPAPNVSSRSRGAIGAKVELVGLRAARAMGVPGRHEHDRAGGEGDAAVLDLGDQDAGGERRDRLVAERLLDRRAGQPARIGAQQLPLVGVLGQQPDGVGQLALAGVDAADQDVQHEVAQLVVGQAVARLFGLDQRRDQVIARAPGGGAAISTSS